MYLDVVHEHIPASSGSVPTEPAKLIVCNATPSECINFLLEKGEAEWHKYSVIRGQTLKEFEARDYLLWMRALDH